MFRRELSVDKMSSVDLSDGGISTGEFSGTGMPSEVLFGELEASEGAGGGEDK